jgi:hypothetical protein
VLLGRWDEQVRLFRWKSLADAAAWRHRRRPRGVVREAIVEAYRPGANIVRWPGRGDTSDQPVEKHSRS